MRLAEFIRNNSGAIVANWEEFAATRFPAARDMTADQLRADAHELLEAVATDLESDQTSDEQRQKSRGWGTRRGMRQIAQDHAIRRMQSGFHLDQVLSEFRALRASVIRLLDQEGADQDRSDLTRFNEAIDEALTESVNRFSQKLEEYRDQFLAVLGHDLRNPLGAVKMSAAFLARSEGLDERHGKAAWRIVIAAERMERMVSDLLDLTRTRLGQGIPISKKTMNLGALCRRAVDELHAFHPERALLLECEGDLSGQWDEDRLAQVVSNLVGNALQHGSVSGPVTVRAASDGDRAVLTVHNLGPAIPATSLKTIFDPMVRSSTGRDYAGQARSLGLGLFIVRELVAAHGGTVSVASTETAGTTFTVRLPRRNQALRGPHA